jgi:hypothetical protein
MSVLGRRGVKPDMEFVCCDCDEKFTGQQVIGNSVTLHIVKVNKEEPLKSQFRCECCQDDHHEKHCTCECDD